jgi:hypothetical protein
LEIFNHFQAKQFLNNICMIRKFDDRIFALSKVLLPSCLYEIQLIARRLNEFI